MQLNRSGWRLYAGNLILFVAQPTAIECCHSRWLQGSGHDNAAENEDFTFATPSKSMDALGAAFNGAWADRFDLSHVTRRQRGMVELMPSKPYCQCYFQWQYNQNMATTIEVDESPLSCDVCHIGFSAQHLKSESRITVPIAQLETAVASGCAFCGFIGSKVLPFEPDLNYNNSHRNLEIIYRDYASGSTLGLLSSGEEDSFGRRTTYHFGDIRLTPLQGYVASQFKATDNPWSQHPRESWLVARQWLQQCQSKHGSCAEVSSGASLPTRLIDLTDAAHPRLVQGATLVNDTDYATLSHCWGSYQPLTLTHDNLDLFLKSIPLHRLPPLHRDACEAVANLGLQYLWIDSLCIIQDSEDDWIAESAIMHQVYECATVNLAAANAADSSGSLYPKRDLLFQHVSRPFRMRINGIIADYYASNCEMATRELACGPLNRRAWVLQELLLSRRTISFCRGQVFWVCRNSQACEIFPGGTPVQYTDSPLDIQTIRARGLLKAWSSIVHLYTRATLTYPDKDRLVALLGLAKKAHNPSEYCAGLWASQFPLNLLWRVGRYWQPGEEPERFVAPSWSWAAVYGYVAYREVEPNDGTLSKFCSIFDCRVWPEAQDKTGNIRFGMLKLHGFLLKTRLRLTEDTGLYFDCCWRFVVAPELVISVLAMDGPMPNDTDEYYLLPVCWAGRFVGLLLQRTAQHAVYCRVGLFATGSNQKEHILWDAPIAIHAQKQVMLEIEELEFLRKCQDFTDQHENEESLSTVSASGVRLPPKNTPSGGILSNARMCELILV